MIKRSDRNRRRTNSVLRSCFVEPLEQRQMLSTTIVSGQTIAGKISTVGQKTSYTFTAKAGQTFIADVGDSSTASTYLPEITVTGPKGPAGTGYGYYTGTGLAGNYYTNSSAEVVVTAALSGTYTFVVQDQQGKETGGTYDLEVAAAPATQASDADGNSGPIASGQTKAGTINHFGDLDIYTYTATAGQTFIADLGDSVSTSTFLPQLNVYGPDGATVGTGYGYYAGTGLAANYYTNSSAQIVVTAAKAGIYTFVVQDQKGSESGGTYDLEVAAAPATQATDADGNSGTITSGQTKAGTINHFGDLDIYTYTATAGQTFIADLGDAVSTSTFLPQLDVYGPTGAAAGMGYGYYAGTGLAANYYTNSSAQIIVTAAKAGTYTFVVQDQKGMESGGTYDLEVAAAPATQAADSNGNGGTISSGQTKAGAINHFGDLDVYTYTATAGQTFFADLGDATSASTFLPQLDLYGPDGALAGTGYGYYAGTGLAANYYTNSSGLIVVTAAKTGVYTLVVQDQKGMESGGTYDLEVAAVPATQATDADGTGGALTSGIPKTGTINHFGDLDVYTFTATSKDTFNLSLKDSNTTTLYEPEVHLYGPTAAAVGTGAGYYDGVGFAASYLSNTSVQITGTIPATGTYVAIVQDYKGTETGGAYTVELNGNIHPVSQATVAVTAPSPQTATAGTAKSFSLGSFTAENATAPYSVDISWGDGTADTKITMTAAGTIPAQSHTYAKAGSDTASVVVTDAKGNVSNKATFGVTVTAAVTAKIAVTPAAAQTASPGVSKSFTIGSFTATGGMAPYSVDISWGDGTADTKITMTAAGTIPATSHTFAKAATDTVSIVVTDAKKITSNKATFAVTVSAGTSTSSISGTVFNDANVNKKFDPTELGLDGWQVYIDVNKDGKYDSGDKLATTNINGAWSFTGLTGGTYEVRVVQVAGTATTTTGGTLQTISLIGGKPVTGVLFGEERIT